MPLRFDTGTLDQFQRTPSGGVAIPARPTRTGVFPYLLQDGAVRRELRPADEVFAAQSLATLRHAPVTDLHPEKEGIRIPVTPENHRELSRGHVDTDVRPDGSHVASTLLVQDGDLILKIEAGSRRECSCGYVCDLDMTPGVTADGEIYDAIQRNIRYNHVALGPTNWGRAGSSVALRLDSGDAIQQVKDRTVEQETIDGVTYKVGSPEHLATLRAQAQKERGRADGAEKALKAEKEKAPDPKAFHAQVTARVRLVSDCKRAARSVGQRFDEDAAASETDESLIAAAIKLLDPSFDPNSPDAKNPAYLKGYFTSLMKGIAGETAEAEPQTTEPGTGLDGGTKTTAPGMAPGTVPAPKTDAKDPARPSIFTARAGAQDRTDANQPKAPDPDKARADMNDRNRARWNKPLASSKK